MVFICTAIKFVQTQNTQIASMLKIEFNHEKDFFVIRMGKISEIVSANFIRHQLGLSYVKKDGTVVTVEDIQTSKDRAQQAYADKVVSK